MYILQHHHLGRRSRCQCRAGRRDARIEPRLRSISDLINTTTGSTTPDVIDFADWDGAATPGNPGIPDADWASHERIHQYSGGVDQTFGGYTINVDQDYLDLQGSFSAPEGGVLGDVSGDGRPDILAIAKDGDLLAYPNTGGAATGTFGTPTQVGAGWNGYTIVAAADLYGVGRPGLLAIAPAGTLFYYPNTGGTATGTFGQPAQVGSGWNGWTVDSADINGDGKPDLLAVDSAGTLFYYPNTGGTATGTFGQPAQVGSGWNGWRAIDVGVLSGTRAAGILGIDSTGTLYEFPNTSTAGTVAFGRSEQVGSDWIGYAIN